MTEAGLDLQGVEDALPLSPAQQGMLFHSLSEPETGVYLGLFSALLPADLDVDAFKASWRDAIARHQALRGLFVWAGVDEPLLVVRDEADPVWEELDWRGLGASDTQSAQREQLDAARRAGLDLSQAPAMRLILTLLRDGRRRFLWVCHHALVDDWSAANVLREVQQHYAQRVRGVATALPPAMPYRDFADWLAGQSREACDAYWGEAFAGVEEPTRLQTPPAEGTARHDDPYGVVEVVLSADATESLVRTAASLRTTLGNMTTAVWGVVLHRLSGLDDVMFGVAATMRPPELPGVDDAVGNFVTTLPARLRIDQSATMRDLIRVRHEDALAARAHKGISLTRLHELTGLPQGEPLFDTIISIKQDAMAQIASEGETALFSEITGRVRSNFPLALIVMPGERLKLELLFDESIIGEESARMILMMAERAMTALPSHLDRLPFDLPVMTDAERAEAEAGDASDIRLPEFDLVHTEILARVREAPDAPAVVFQDGVLTYGALGRLSKRLARRIAARGLGQGDRVGIFLDRGLDLPVAILGALRAGCAYVPLDPQYPAARLGQMLENAKAKALVTDARHAETLPRGAPPVLRIDADEEAGADLPTVSPDDAAYVIYTSGSTGKPKGVVVTHANLSASTAARFAWYRDRPDVFLLLSSFAFDSSVAGIFWTLCAGGILVLPAPGAEMEVQQIGDLVERHAVTHTLCLPSLYELIVEYVPPGKIKSLRTLIVAGEAMTPALVTRHRETRPGARLVNEYGPTEGTVWSTVFDLAELPPGGPVAIGRAVPGARTVLRDRRGRPTPTGLPAELLVGGPGVAAGYLDMSAETEARFVPDPVHPGHRLYRTGDLVRRRHDGVLEYLGRSDNQVKIRGYRVELAEIEAVFSARPDIREAAVALIGIGARSILAAYVVPQPGVAPEQQELTTYARDRLPEWMVPARFVLVEALPRTASGKIDRRALPAPDRDTGDQPFVPPSTSMEAVLSQIWRRVLWLDRDVGVNEDFFELGGHSLLSMRLVNEIEAELDLKIPIASLGRITTVSEQARLLTEAARGSETPSAEAAASQITGGPGPFAGLTPDELQQMHAYIASWPGEPAFEGSLVSVLNAEGKLPPLFFWFTSGRQFENLAISLGPDQPIYGMRAGNDVVDHPSEDQQLEDQRRVALSHVADVLKLGGDGPFYLGGNCQGATIALNVALALAGFRKSVATVFLLDKAPPIKYNGRVAIAYSGDGFLNPYLRFQQPEHAWRQLYREHSIDLIPCRYMEAFDPPYLQLLGRIIHKRMKEARESPLSPLPADAVSVAWTGTRLPHAVAPGARFTASVGLRNASTRIWGKTRDSGIRLVGRWHTPGGESVPGASYAAEFESPLGAGESRTLCLDMAAPDRAGPYRLVIDLVEEGVAYFSQRGGEPLHFDIMADPAAPATGENSRVPAETVPPGVQAAAGSFGTGEGEELSADVRAATGRSSGSAAKLVDGTPDDAIAILREHGLRMLDIGNLAEAARGLESLKDLDPDNAETFIALGRLRQAQRRHLEAFQLFRRARALASDEDTRLLADCYLERINYPKRVYLRLAEKVARRLTRLRILRTKDGPRRAEQ